MRAGWRRQAIIAAIATGLLAGCVWRPGAGVKGVEVKEREARDAAIESYVFGYPLVTMEMTRRVMTNVAAPAATFAPMGQFAKLRNHSTPADKEVTATNADTLHTLAWLDVSKEPWVLSLPDKKGRYYLFPMLDGWTDVFGKRTTGTGPQTYAITGPGWNGTLPSGVTEYKSPTGMVWILGRIYCTGTSQDHAPVDAVHDQVSVVPLTSYGRPYSPPPGIIDPKVDMKTPVRDQVNALDGATFFKLLAQLMKTNPPAAADAAMVAKLGKIGIVPGQDFDASKLEPAVAKGIEAAPRPAQEKILAWMKEGIVFGDNKIEDRWLYPMRTGLSGAKYRQRAFVTWVGLGANRPQDGTHPMSEGSDVLPPVDASNHPRCTMPTASSSRIPSTAARSASGTSSGRTRRLGGPPRPARLAGEGERGELAAGAGQPVHPDAAAVLPE